MNAFQQGYVYGLWKLGFSEEFAEMKPPMPHEEFREAKGATPPKSVSTASNAPKGGMKAPAAEKAGKGLSHYGRQAGAWIGKNPKAALGLGAAGLLAGGLAGHAMTSHDR